MTDHWQVIEGALEFWRSGEMFDEERMHIDAALAFVREQQLAERTLPDEVREAISYLVANSLDEYNVTLPETQPHLDAVLKWLDAQGKATP